MTKPIQIKTELKHENLQALLSEREDFLKPLLKALLQEVMETQMTEILQAAKHERKDDRLGYRSGYYERNLITRVGPIELRIPQDRNGLFSTEIFERYQRSEKALVNALVQMYVQGVSTRKVKKITEDLCGHRFSASSISRFNKKLDVELKAFNERQLDKQYPYVITDARYEKVRENGVVRSRAILIAIGVNWSGRREILSVDLSNRESTSSWKEFLKRLKQRGLRGVKLVISDDHKGLKRAIREIFPESLWQRCYVHFLRNAFDYIPRKHDENCMLELRWIYQRKNIEEARIDLKAWLHKWAARYSRLCDWVEENIEETLSFYTFPQRHHKSLKSNNVLERLNEEIARRTRVIRVFPDESSCLRLIQALAVEMHEEWMEATVYLNMEYLKELHKETVRKEIAA